VVLPAVDRSHIGCFSDQVKLTRALLRDLDEASKKITELEALCKRLREDAQKLREQKTKLKGMVESHDKLIMETADRIGLNCMGDNAEDEEDNEDEDDDNGGDAAAPLATPPSPAPPIAAREAITVEE
jgi:predicted  nucleic acid-binding Zn-ribbon protein